MVYVEGGELTIAAAVAIIGGLFNIGLDNGWVDASK